MEYYILIFNYYERIIILGNFYGKFILKINIRIFNEQNYRKQFSGVKRYLIRINKKGIN